MVGYFVPVDCVELTITSTSIADSSTCYILADAELPPVPSTGLKTLARRGLRERVARLRCLQPNTARQRRARIHHDLRPP
jgi:hypothetical protein